MTGGAVDPTRPEADIVRWEGRSKREKNITLCHERPLRPDLCICEDNRWNGNLEVAAIFLQVRDARDIDLGCDEAGRKFESVFDLNFAVVIEEVGESRGD